MRLLVIMPMPDRVRVDLRERLLAACPELHLDIVDHPDKADTLIGEADILMAYHMPDRLAAKAARLKWIQSLGTGMDNFLSLPSLRHDVWLTRMHGIQGAPASEAALGSMFALSRRLPDSIRNQGRAFWDRDSRAAATLLTGKVVGILGVGQIAEALAPKCKALGMTVIGVSSARDSVPGFDEIRPRENLLEYVRELDYLVVLVPLTPSTRHIVNADLLRRMKPSTYLINLARGGVVDEAALVNALQQARIAGAALDVFAQEPLPADSPLWSLPNVIITPHAAGMHDAYVADLMPILTTNLRAFLRGTPRDMVHQVAR